MKKLGTFDELLESHDDPIDWAKNYIKDLTAKEKEAGKSILVAFSPVKVIDKNVANSFNGGYLFLQKFYYQLGINNIVARLPINISLVLI